MRSVAVVAFVLGCGAARVPPALPPTSGHDVRTAGEASLVVLTRPLADELLVQLWIDAGSLDAAVESGHPEVASLAGWVAEQRATDVRARALPDGTVLSWRGAALEDGAAALLSALAARSPSAAELSIARETLRARRRGRAPDALAELELTAVTALLGPVDPLGVVGVADEDPAEDAVARFLENHYGLSRARWVVLGPIGADEAEATLLGVRSPVAAAHETPRRRIPTTTERALEGDDGFAIAALTAGTEPTPGGAWGIAATDGLGRTSRFRTPCGELGVLASRAPLDASTLARLSFALHALPADDAATATGADHDAELRGLAFVARAERCEAPREGLALVVGASDEARAARIGREALAALTAPATSSIAHADVDGRSTVLAIRFDGGASMDTPATHGATAVVARALGEHCGARVRIGPEAVQVEVDLGERGDDGAIGAVLACVLAEPVPDRAFSLAQTTALAALDDEARFLDRAALVLAPGAPGVVAPLGSASGIAGAHDLMATLHDLRRRPMRVGVVSPTPPSERIARALGSVSPAPTATSSTPAATPGPFEMFVPAIESEVVELVLAFRADGVADATTVAALLGAELDASALSVVRAAAGVFGDTSWMAFALRGEPTAIDGAMDAASAAAVRAEARLTDALDQAERQRAEHERASGASPSEVARALVAPPAVSSTRDAALALLRAAPRRVVVRPATPPVRRR